MSHQKSNHFDLSTLKKVKQIIHNSIKSINLDLSRLTVLTEAATGNWAYTPFIAALSGAQVICYTRNSKYGKTKEIIHNFEVLSKYFNIQKRIHVYKNLTQEIIGQSDIVTNSGLLRPIDKKFINSMKKTAVISLMWEPWEFRNKDLDLMACMKRGIAILGVNEDNPILNIAKYNGENILRILSANKISIKRKNILVVVENRTYSHMIKALISHGAKVVLVSESMCDELNNFGVPVIQDLKSSLAIQFLKKCNLIIINSAPLKKKIIGGKYGLSISLLKKINPTIKILIYFGNVDYVGIKKAGLICLPTKNPGLGYMPWTLDFLGPNPTIELNALGLKVGELLAKNRLSGFDVGEAKQKALASPFCLDFTTEQKKYLKLY